MMPRLTFEFLNPAFYLKPFFSPYSYIYILQFTTPLQVELSSEQVDRIMASDEFCSFVNRASRLMERAMSDTSDILFDQIINGGKEGR